MYLIKPVIKSPEIQLFYGIINDSIIFFLHFWEDVSTSNQLVCN